MIFKKRLFKFYHMFICYNVRRSKVSSFQGPFLLSYGVNSNTHEYLSVLQICAYLLTEGVTTGINALRIDALEKYSSRRPKIYHNQKIQDQGQR